MNNIGVVIYKSNQNRYSFNALLGALESTKVIQKIDVYFYDPQDDKDDMLRNCINTHKKTVLMFSFFTTQVWDIKSELMRIKNMYGESIIYLAGGPHPTGMPKEVLHMGFDYVLIGEGEKIINDFLNELLEDGDKVLPLSRTFLI